MTAQAQCRREPPYGVPSPSPLGHRPGGLPCPDSLPAWTALVSPRHLPLSFLHQSSGFQVVQECVTCCPSGTAFAFPLGPTNPPRIILAAEPSDFRWGRFTLPFSVTHSGIRTPTRSTEACASTSLRIRRSPTITACAVILCFGMMLCPVTASAHGYSTSELLRILLRMAASKPTSWLSQRPHNLSHSASIWGP